MMVGRRSVCLNWSLFRGHVSFRGGGGLFNLNLLGNDPIWLIIFRWVVQKPPGIVVIFVNAMRGVCTIYYLEAEYVWWFYFLPTIRKTVIICYIIITILLLLLSFLLYSYSIWLEPAQLFFSVLIWCFQWRVFHGFRTCLLSIFII